MSLAPRCPGDPQQESTAAAGIRILFADDFLIVVDKPAGMPSVPARTPLDPPCVAAVLRDACGFLEAVHRLDRDTSGVLVMARTTAARAALGRAFEAREVRKRYEAVTWGRPPCGAGVVHLPLAPDPSRPPRQRVDPILGRPATTRWRLLEVGDPRPGMREQSLLELEPITGRSHQIRVHLAWLGMPIVGDRLYGPSVAAASGERLSLHACSLLFPHPVDGRSIEIAAPSSLRLR